MKSVKISYGIKPINVGKEIELDNVKVLVGTSQSVDAIATLKKDVSFEEIRIEDIESVETTNGEIFKNEDLSEYLRVTIFYDNKNRDLR